MGHRVENLEDLLKTTNMFFDNYKKPIDKKSLDKDFEKIKSKIFIDKDKLASEKIIDLWESVFDEKNTKTIGWRKLKFILMIKN